MCYLFLTVLYWLLVVFFFQPKDTARKKSGSMYGYYVLMSLSLMLSWLKERKNKDFKTWIQTMFEGDMGVKEEKL